MQSVYPFCGQELLEQLFASFAMGILLFPNDDWYVLGLCHVDIHLQEVLLIFAVCNSYSIRAREKHFGCKVLQ